MDADFEEARKLDEQYVMHTFGRKPVEFVSGKGMHLYDSKGREYLDFLAGIGVCSLGHCHPDVVAAIEEQAAKLLHVSNYYYIEHRGELARAISDLLSRNEPDALGNTGKGWQTFFANSGAEANEGAIKLARHYGNRVKGGDYYVVTALRSFHGRTLATLFATGQAAKQEPFEPKVDGFVHVPLNDVDALRAALDDKDHHPVAVMLECIQGEGGVNPCTTEYLRAAREMTLERGMLLIIDEVQSGYYRTGKPFSFQHFGIVPDIVTMAKGMGDGVPIAGFAAPGELGLELAPGEHGTTFGGGPLVCAASLATLTAFEKLDIGAHVSEVGAYLQKRLATLPHVREVRGRGLMVGVELDEPIAPDIVASGLDAGLVLNFVSPNVLRFLPPLICEKTDVDTLVEKLADLMGNK